MQTQTVFVFFFFFFFFILFRLGRSCHQMFSAVLFSQSAVSPSRAAKPVFHLEGGTGDRKLIFDRSFASLLCRGGSCRQVSCRQPPRQEITSTARGLCQQPPRGDPWKMSSQLKQMKTPRECIRSGKRIDPRP